MKTKGFVVACLLLLALPACKALVGALIEYIDTWDQGPNGRVRKVGEIENEEQVGEWTFSYENGNRMAAGQYKNDHPYGPWSHWYQNGNLKSQGSHDDDGARTGLWTYYHDNGVPSARGSLVQDHEQGPWTFTDRTGARLQRGAYDGGLRVGLWTCWYPDGRTSTEGCYAADERVGAWRVWTESGELATTEYPLPEGVVLQQEVWSDGRPRRLGMLQQGKRIGTWITWHRNGERRLVCCFQGGTACGTWESYRENGQLLAEGELREGMLEDWRIWSADTNTAQQRMPLPPLPPAPGGEWSSANLANTESAAVVLAVWLTELRNPKTYRTARAVPADVQVAWRQDVAELDVDRRAVPDPQPAWTERERAEYDKWVKAYSVGMAELRSLMGRYGGSSRRRPKAKVSNREIMLDQPCPFDELRCVDGSTVKLSDYRGTKKVLIVILRGYSGEVCVYCVAQTEALANYEDAFKELNLEVLVVYPGPKVKEQAFRECFRAEFGGEPPPYRTFYDPGLQLVQQLGIQGGREAYPTTLLIDEDGIVRYAYTGKNAADRPAAQNLIKLIEKLKKT